MTKGSLLTTALAIILATLIGYLVGKRVGWNGAVAVIEQLLPQQEAEQMVVGMRGEFVEDQRDNWMDQ